MANYGPWPSVLYITMASNLSTLTFASSNKYEKTSYYNGITRDSDHLDLVYHSDFLTMPFSKPVGRHAHIPVKLLCGVFDTPLNGIWDAVSSQIHDLIKAWKIKWSSIDPSHFFTHAPLGEVLKGCLGSIVIWVGVTPGSISTNTTHEVFQEILTLLQKNGVDSIVVEWCKAVLQRLIGHPLICHVDSSNATHYVHRFLTALLGVPLGLEEMDWDSQGALMLWFHEKKDKDSNPSNKVYGVSNCYVLHKKTTVDYKHRLYAPMNHVQVCGMC